MSTVILDKDHEDKKRGETVSVPFSKGKAMVADGSAHYPAGASSPQAPAKETQALKDEAAAALKKQEDSHKAEVARLHADAKAAFDMADKATAENAKLKERIAELEKSHAIKPHTAK